MLTRPPLGTILQARAVTSREVMVRSGLRMLRQSSTESTAIDTKGQAQGDVEGISALTQMVKDVFIVDDGSCDGHEVVRVV